MEKSCCFTGYRPDKFSFPLEFGEPEFSALEGKIYNAVFEAEKREITTFYCGMAAGFDLLCGRAVVELKRMKPENGIRLIAAIPFEGQSKYFPPMWKRLYEIVLSEVDEKIVISDRYTKPCFFERNKLMVDNSDTVITYYDGKSGGTAYTLRYAEKSGKEIINLCDSSSVQLEIE